MKEDTRFERLRDLRENQDFKQNDIAKILNVLKLLIVIMS